MYIGFYVCPLVFGLCGWGALLDIPLYRRCMLAKTRQPRKRGH